MRTRDPISSLGMLFAIGILAAMIACDAASLQTLAAPGAASTLVADAQSENNSSPPPAAQPAGPPRENEDHDPPAIPGQDELFLFGELPDSALDSTYQSILALGVRTVVFDCPLWTAYPEQVKALSTRLRRGGVAIVLHLIMHPLRDGQVEWKGSDAANVLKMYRACGASGIYDDGSGAGRSDAALNARLYPEIKELLDALPWPPTYFATANALQVSRGDPRLIKSIGFTDWYRDDPGWGNFSKDFWRQLDGAVRMTNEETAKVQRARPMLGWVRWHPDWDDPVKQVAEMQAVMSAAARHDCGISWQISVQYLPRITPLARKAFAVRAEYMALKAGKK